MLFEYVISEPEERVFIRFEGSGDFQKSVAGIMSVASDPGFKSNFDIVVDVCKMNYFPGITEVKDFAEVLSSLKEKCSGKIALIVSSFFHYGIGMILAGILELNGIKLQVFRRLDEATHWLKEKKHFDN
jgi:hypothetical protein